jgi:transposase
MRTAIATHELLPMGLDLESFSIETGHVSISVSSGTRRSVCPLCGRASSRVHSRYTRTVSDLPWHGISVELEVRARRFFCDEPSCERKIFCERLPEVAARARKTVRLWGRLCWRSPSNSAAEQEQDLPWSWASWPRATPC